MAKYRKCTDCRCFAWCEWPKIVYHTETETHCGDFEREKRNMIRYYIFCIRWLWKHRHWKNTRQKFKAMEKDWEKRR